MGFPFATLNTYGSETKMLGSGAYGSVYLYIDKKGERYAIKKQERVGSSISTLREIVIMKELCCDPNIVSLIDVIFSGEFTYMVMPAGIESLKDTINNSIPSTCIKPHIYNIVRGMVWCTSKNIIHRDLKPANIIRYKDGLKIGDFGISRDDVCLYIDEGMSKDMFTLWYRAPEVLLGGKYGFKADVWALGCIIAEMVMRTPLFEGESESDQLNVIFKMLGTPLDDVYMMGLPRWEKFPIYKRQSFPKEINIDEQLSDLLDKMLTINPEKRYTIFEVISHPYFKDIYIEGAVPEVKICEDRLLNNVWNPSKTNLNDNNRFVLFEWISDVVTAMETRWKACVLSYYIFDMLCQNLKKTHKINAEDLQDYMSSCFVIASAMIDVYNINAQQMCRYSKCKSEEKLLKLIEEICKLCDFKFYITTWYDFMIIYSKYQSSEVKDIATSIGTTIYSNKLGFKYTGEQIAIASIIMACKIYNEKFSYRYKLTEDILKLVSEASNIQNLKYSKAYKGIFERINKTKKNPLLL